MQAQDDDLQVFEAEGAAPLPPTNAQGHVEHDGARIWYTSYGFGHPVILLHGGLGHSGNWGYQVPAVIASGYRAVLIDSRGHGRSTRDSRPYELRIDGIRCARHHGLLHLERACVVGWSDGACTALILATKVPARIAGVFFFACNMDSSGVKEIAQPNPLLDRCFRRHAKDYAELSATPEEFKAFTEAVGLMQKTQPKLFDAAAGWHLRARRYCPRRARRIYQTRTCRISCAKHSESGTAHPSRRQPFRTSAKTRAV